MVLFVPKAKCMGHKSRIEAGIVLQSFFFFLINFLQNFYFLFPECWGLQSWWPWSSRETSTRGYVGFAELEGEIGHFGEKNGVSYWLGKLIPTTKGNWVASIWWRQGTTDSSPKSWALLVFPCPLVKVKGKTIATKTKVRPLRIRPSLGRRVWVTLPTKEPQPPVVLAKGKEMEKG